MLLSACAAEMPWQSSSASSSPEIVNEASTECSIFGRLACRAMAVVASDGTSQQGTCTATRSGSTRVETCGGAGAMAGAPTPRPQSTQEAARADVYSGPRSSVQLAWQDNSKDETGFIIERCDNLSLDTRGSQLMATCRGPWLYLASVGANVTSYTDRTVVPKQTYMYRVKATNPSGSSAYTPEAAITAPEK